MTTTYISTTETAKLIRAALQRHFPTVKFSIRSKKYAGGSSIDVEWTDGPSSIAVDAIIKQYEGGRFDGMIDLAYNVSHWLMPDGSAVVASDPGTVGNAGSRSAERNWMPAPDAKLVRFSVSHVFSRRRQSAALLRRVLDRLSANGYPTDGIAITEGSYGAWFTVDRSIDRRGFDMERELHRALVRTHCVPA